LEEVPQAFAAVGRIARLHMGKFRRGVLHAYLQRLHCHDFEAETVS
jgi:hypothetical protein